MALNKVYLLGNLTRDPELRFTASGMAIASLGIALNKKWKTDSGEEKESVTFVDVNCFGKRAETYCAHHKKGSKTFIEGELKMETWDDKTTGKKMSKLVVNMDGFEFVGGNQDGPKQPPQSAPTKRQAAPAAGQPTTTATGDDSDVPF